MSAIFLCKRFLGTPMTFVCVVLGYATIAAPAPAHPVASGCAATFNLFIPGTWETNEAADPAEPVGMLGPIARAIQRQQGAESDIYFTPYMARAFDNGHTYADSKNTALENARTTLDEYHTRCAAAQFTITGYSQGADAAGDLAADIGNDRGPVPAEQVLAVGLLADPAAGTTGTTTVGPRTTGSGIADPRPLGMGKLAGRVTSICDPEDLYCSIEKTTNPLLGLIGSILSKSPDSSPFASALTSDSALSELPGLAGAVDGLIAGRTGVVNLAQVRDSAREVEKIVRSLATLIGSGTTDQATAGLAAAAIGTAEHNAGEVLAGAGQSDLAAAESALRTITGKAAELLDRGIRTLAPNSPDATMLSTTATTLSGQIAPLVDIRVDILGSASQILSMLEPSVLINQALAVVGEAAALDLPWIRAQLLLLSQKVAALDARGAHQVAGELNNHFQQLVELVGGIDLERVARVLPTMPDQQGYLQIAARVAAALAEVDVNRLAHLVGTLQEGAWSVLEKLVPPPGQTPDPIGAAAALTGLLPLGADLASAAANLLTGIDRDRTGKTGPLAEKLAPMGTNLLELINEGLSAATFFASGAHINYASLIVDNSGRNAIQWLGDWLNGSIRSTHPR